MDSPDTIKALDRYLSPVDVWSMAFGCMVGWGVFAMPGNTFLPVAGPAGTLIAMLSGMCIMLVIGSNLSYLMGRSAITGGVYSYTKEAFGRDHAFLCAWFLCLSYLTIVFLNGTALFYIIRTLMGDVIQNGHYYMVAGNRIYVGETVVSALVLSVIGYLFVTAKPLLQRLNTALSLVLFVGIALTGAFCLPRALSSGVLTDFGAEGIHPAGGVFSIVVMAPWAFVGFEVTAFDTAHFRFPVQRTKGLIVLSVLATALAYGLMTVVSVAAVPEGFASWQAYIMSLNDLSGIPSVPTFFAAKTILGTAGLAAMVVTAAAAILTGIIGGYRAAMRVLSTMAEDRILSEEFSKTSYSIVFIMVISIALSLLGRNTLNWFVDLTSFGAIVGFGYSSAAAWKLASAEENRRNALTGMAGTLLSALFVTVQIVPRLTALDAMGSEAFLLLSLWCLLGFVFYWRTVNHSTLTEYSGLSVSGIVLFALLIYSSLMWLAKHLAALESMEAVRSSLVRGGAVLCVLVFAGMVIMLYVQNLVRSRHEESERDKIRAVESSLAKSQFLFNMSHDIRTPMNAIIGYTKLALAEPSSPELHSYLEKIDLSSQHLLSLINDILEMSRIESGKIELEYAPSDLTALFQGIEDLFSQQMQQKGIAFAVHTAQVQDPFVWCDGKNLNRVLLNVLSNAYKFTPSGGSVSVSLWEAGTENGYGIYEIRIKDDGIGMSREFADRMFTAFERERSSTVSGTEGTGLGLAITKSIIDLMGGTIEVLTAPGSGTEFLIRLKLKLAEQSELPKPAQPPEAAAEENEVDFTRKRLLLVEDNLVNLEIAKMILTQMGFPVETAENGKIAVDMVADSRPGYYSAVLMDIQMPVMDGYEAARAIRALPDQALSRVPIIAVTANAFKEDVDAAREAGMQAHVAKPLDLDDLRDTLVSILLKSEAEEQEDPDRTSTGNQKTT